MYGVGLPSSRNGQSGGHKNMCEEDLLHTKDDLNGFFEKGFPWVLSEYIFHDSAASSSSFQNMIRLI